MTATPKKNDPQPMPNPYEIWHNAFGGRLDAHLTKKKKKGK